MLELHGLQCWIATHDNIILPETLTSTGEPDVVNTVNCTVKLNGRKVQSTSIVRVFFPWPPYHTPQSYIIHWKAVDPITAWCEVHTKNAAGKVTSPAAACEMDATKPDTQVRCTKKNTMSGYNLALDRPRSSCERITLAVHFA